MNPIEGDYHLCDEAPAQMWSLLQRQPFCHIPPAASLEIYLTQTYGQWHDLFSDEQTAYALSVLSAATVLPALTQLENGYELLEYNVLLRDHFSDLMVREIITVLDSSGEKLHWEHVAEQLYICVIGSGVAACIDITYGREQLYLRYDNKLAEVLFHAQRKAELPRSLLFLQSTLYERFDALLALARQRAWFQVTR